MKILRFNSFIGDLLQEKSIGSEAIRDKFYSDIDKKVFYKLVNLDPTSVRKKDFSKPGDYSRWLLTLYKKYYKQCKEEYFESSAEFQSKHPDVDECCSKAALSKIIYDDLNFHLFIFSSNWYKKEAKAKGYNNDILKFKSVVELKRLIDPLVGEFKKQTEDAKFDVVYQDDKVKILIPLNFTAAAETAKNTDWCTTKLPNYQMWNNWALMFRILPIDSKYDKLKITWMRDNKKDMYDKSWYIACSEYPEMGGTEGTPFDIVDGEESWAKVLRYYNDVEFNREVLEEEIKKQNISYSGFYSPRTRLKLVDLWINNSKKIVETIGLLSPEAKKAIVYYYNKFGESNQAN